MDEKRINKMKKLIATGRQKGKVLPVSEAFRRFPVEEEVHKGKIEFVKKG